MELLPWQGGRSLSRELFAYAEGLDHLPDVSASFCVDRLLPRLRREQWLLILDGTEVAQHDSGSCAAGYCTPSWAGSSKSWLRNRCPASWS